MNQIDQSTTRQFLSLWRACIRHYQSPMRMPDAKAFCEECFLFSTKTQQI